MTNLVGGHIRQGSAKLRDLAQANASSDIARLRVQYR